MPPPPLPELCQWPMCLSVEPGSLSIWMTNVGRRLSILKRSVCVKCAWQSEWKDSGSLTRADTCWHYKMIGGENAQGQSPKEFSTFCCSELGPRVSLVWIQVTSLILTCCLVEMEYGWKFRESQGSQNPFSSTFLVFVFLKMHKAKLYYHMVLPICSRWIQTPIIYIYTYLCVCRGKFVCLQSTDLLYSP